MAITLHQSLITKTLTNQKTIDSDLISPKLGANIKLVNSAIPTNYFVGTVSELIATIKNADRAIYTAMKLDGIDNNGTKKTITLTIEQIENNDYTSGYDKMYYTTSLQNTISPNIKEEASDDIVIGNASIDVFDIENVSLGKSIVYKKDLDSLEVSGIISAIDSKGENVKVTTFAGNKLATNTLTLIEATSDNFEGTVINIL